MAAKLVLSMGLARQARGAHEGGGESGAAGQQLGASVHREPRLRETIIARCAALPQFPAALFWGAARA